MRMNVEKLKEFLKNKGGIALVSVLSRFDYGWYKVPSITKLYFALDGCGDVSTHDEDTSFRNNRFKYKFEFKMGFSWDNYDGEFEVLEWESECSDAKETYLGDITGVQKGCIDESNTINWSGDTRLGEEIVNELGRHQCDKVSYGIDFSNQTSGTAVVTKVAIMENQDKMEIKNIKKGNLKEGMRIVNEEIANAEAEYAAKEMRAYIDTRDTIDRDEKRSIEAIKERRKNMSEDYAVLIKADKKANK